MPKQPHDFFEKFERWNLFLHHAAEQAEGAFERISRFTQTLVATGLLPEMIVFGATFDDRGYHPSANRDDSGLFSQAVLHAPKGIGIVIWDTEQYYALQHQPNGLQEMAMIKFVPYTECDVATKAIPALQIGDLMEKLLKNLRIS
jgi:hypothetical protein